jgi:hypothetical protein
VSTQKEETTLQQRIQKAVRERGGYAVKIHGSVFQPDAVDLVICYRGRFVGLEAKVLGEEATPRQAKRLREISAAGGRASVVFAVSDVMKVLDDIDEEDQAWLTWRSEMQERVRSFGPHL